MFLLKYKIAGPGRSPSGAWGSGQRPTKPVRGKRKAQAAPEDEPLPSSRAEAVQKTCVAQPQEPQGEEWQEWESTPLALKLLRELAAANAAVLRGQREHESS